MITFHAAAEGARPSERPWTRLRLRPASVSVLILGNLIQRPHIFRKSVRSLELNHQRLASCSEAGSWDDAPAQTSPRHAIRELAAIVSHGKSSVLLPVPKRRGEGGGRNMATSLIPHRGNSDLQQRNQNKKNPPSRCQASAAGRRAGGGGACFPDSSERLFCETRGRCFSLQSCSFSR